MAGLESDTWNTAHMRRQLLAWYAANRRDLPWRHTRHPYSIWISEIMLQQTRVAVVVERYKGFLSRFPTVAALAAAPEQDVLAMWSGLGYYRRARMLHKAAQVVAEHRQGNLPTTAEELRMLPGIGSYTAAAIASIAHDEPVAVVDGNVERVLCRVAGWDASTGKGSAILRRSVEKLAAHLVDPKQPGDFNQAMMELGATVCLPRNPQCLVCPLATECKTRGEHKTVPRPRMLRREAAHALVIRAHSGEVLLQQRTESQTVMPGLWELPPLRAIAVPEADLFMTVRHAIMQVNYEVRVRAVSEEDVAAMALEDGERRWVALDAAAGMALTGLTRKILIRSHFLPTAQRVATKAKLRRKDAPALV